MTWDLVVYYRDHLCHYHDNDNSYHTPADAARDDERGDSIGQGGKTQMTTQMRLEA